MKVRVYTIKQVMVFFVLVVLFSIGCGTLAATLIRNPSDLLQEAVAVVSMNSDSQQIEEEDSSFNMTFVVDEPTASQDNDANVSIPDASVAPSVDTAIPSELKIEVVRNKAADENGRRILIYHTHTYEAYEPSQAYTYTDTGMWRTSDPNYNVVRIGTELAQILTSLGYNVTHDVGEYEPPVLSTSYTRSLAMLDKRTQAGESYDLYIDLHRDAYSESMKNSNSIIISGAPVAKLMMLIGKGTGQTSEGFSLKPEWEKNYAIAQNITDDLNDQCEGLARRISLKTGRFNQHIAPRCILVEVGNNKNTLEEALASIPYLADAIDNTLDKLKRDAL